MWVMGEWAVGQWIVGVTSFRKMYGYMGLRSIGSDQLDRFRTQRYNQEEKEKIQDFASSRSVPFGSDNQTSSLEMCFFSVSMQNHSRTPKTCFTLGLECLGHF